MTAYMGLMSGTSLDGVDVATVELEGREERPEVARLLSFHVVPYEDAFRRRLEEACTAGTGPELSELNFELGRRFAGAVKDALERDGRSPGDVAAVGNGGQTVWHQPPEGPEAGHTLQLGEGAVVTEETGLTVVEDFRVGDVAAAGHGAPLSAYFDRLLLSDPDVSRGIQNLGGMGNLTALPAASGGPGPVAFDTGPGVALLDAAARRLSGEPFDREGRMAAAGRVLERPLEDWLEDDFFTLEPPRTTGRERFGSRRLQRWLKRHDGARPEDLMATLAEVTARSVADALGWLEFELDELYLCGGGARNPALVERIRSLVDPVPVRPLSELGWSGDAREAAAFALLARQHLLGVPAGPAWATGARGPRVLGKRIPAR